MTPPELENFCYAYIDQIAERYAGKLDYIDVINEMIDTTGDGHFHPSPFAAVDDFACKVFKRVRQKIPRAKLIYNDFVHESLYWKVPSDKVYNFVKGLVEADCGPDMVGFESHFTVDSPDFQKKEFLAGIGENIKRYGKLGLGVHFSETDLSTTDLTWNATTQAMQDEGFANLLSICLNQPACEAFQFCSVTDKFGCNNTLSAQPWDRNYQPKGSVPLMLKELDDFKAGHQ